MSSRLDPERRPTVTSQGTGELRGLLSVGVLPEIFRRIFVAQRPGTLHLAFGVDRSDFEFSDGYP
jgi:hypothetical protein